MPGIAFRGGGYKYYKDELGPQSEWYLADNVTCVHEEFLGTKYIEIKFKNPSASTMIFNSCEMQSDDEF
jgi:hypothetical protein